MARRDQDKYSGRGGTTFPDRKVNRPRGRGSMSGGVAATSPEARRRDMGSGSANSSFYGQNVMGDPRNQGAPRTRKREEVRDPVTGSRMAVSRQGTGHYGRGQREVVGQPTEQPIAILSNPVDRGNMLTDIMGAIGLGGIARNVQGVMPQAYWDDPMFTGEFENTVPAGWAMGTYNPEMAIDWEDPASIAAARMPRFYNGQQIFGYGDDIQFDPTWGSGRYGRYTYRDDPRTSIANYLALGMEDYEQGLDGYGRGPLNTGFGYSSTGR